MNPQKMAQLDHENLSDDDKKFIDNAMPQLKRLEEVRLKKLSIYQARKKIAIPLCMVVLPITGFIDYFLLWLQRSNDDGIAGLTLLVAGAVYGWVSHPKRQYIKAYKNEILPSIAQLFGNFIYDLQGKISEHKLLPSKILPKKYNIYKSEDYFKGSYKGVDIEFNEAKLIHKTKSGKKTKRVTKFKGLFILLTCRRKKFLGHTILEKDASKISEWFKEKSTDMKRARMADPKFEKIFDAYTTDQVESRYLIDPLTIENLVGLYEQYNGETLQAAWYDNKLLMMISSKHNHFEPPDIYIPATDPASILAMKHEIGQIITIIDQLDLYDPHLVEEEKRLAEINEKKEAELLVIPDDMNTDEILGRKQ